MHATCRPFRSDSLARLRAHEIEFGSLGGAALFLFGSAGCDDATGESDVDLFIDAECRGTFSLFDRSHMRQRAEMILSIPDDLMT